MSTAKKKKTSSNGTNKAPTDGLGTSGSFFMSLELENIRCFGEKQILDLTDGHGGPARWTIVLGENGTGKTTLLQILAVLDKISSVYMNLSKENNLYLPYGFIDFFEASAFPKSGLFESLPRNPDTYRSFAQTYFCKKTIEKSLIFSELMFKLEFTKKMFLVSDENKYDLPKCFAYGANRRLGASSLERHGSKDATSSLFNDDLELLNAEEWLLQLDYAASKDKDPQGFGRQKKDLEQVTGLLIDILPDVEEIRFDASGGVRPNPKVEFKTPYGWVPLRQLGYGYKTMIAWVVDLAARMIERYPDSLNPLAEPAVVLVDEIDLHLHPRWQRELIAFLTERFPNTQFIATAHSPLIVQAAIDANLALLRREGDHVVIDNDVEPLPGESVEQILTSELFGLKSVRPPKLEMLLERRKELLTKPKLTKADQKELAKLEAEIGPLPVGDTHDQAQKMMDLVEETQRLLRERPGGKS